jgi:hypothetical protein
VAPQWDREARGKGLNQHALKADYCIYSLKWTRLSRQKIIEFLVCVKKNSDYLMLTFSAFSPEYTSQGVR